MSRNTATIKKWVPPETSEHAEVFARCKQVKKSCRELVEKLGTLAEEFRVGNVSKVRKSTIDGENVLTSLNDILDSLSEMNNELNRVFEDLNLKQPSILGFKLKTWRNTLWQMKLKMTYFLQEIIAEVAPLFIFYGEKLLHVTFRMSNIYNLLINLDVKFNLSNTMAISSNTCPYLLYPMRKISITRLLQILAQNRAELCSHKLIDCLLESYNHHENHDRDDCHSDNSSLEIYRALTHHMTPPLINAEEAQKQLESLIIGETEDKINVEAKIDLEHKIEVEENGHFIHLDKLIEHEEQNVLELLRAALEISPSMLGHDGVKKAKDGTTKISAKATEKVLDYYQEILWGEVGNFLEHIILWWGPSPLAARTPHSSQHLREWLAQFTPMAEIPSFIVSTLTSLADGLGVHVTSTSWDKNFRLALVATKHTNPDTGQLFCDMLQDLVSLCNQCEVTNDWIVGAPLDELPLVEQIPVLHRLDHSVHTTRLWAASETKKLANSWNVHAFFNITHCDIINCLSNLGNVRMNDHTLQIERGGLGVHVEVCAKMREKLTSEVQVNITKLKETSKECVECLASVCTTISLANLQMIFPRASYWSRSGSGYPEMHSSYVYKYLGQVLTPVLSATEDFVICNMILKLMCEGWLDHIYNHKIKFSEHGALQLLVDFASVATWITDCEIINDTMRTHMLKNEVLRRCEGVGRLLLRNPGEKIKMNEKYVKKNEPEESPKSTMEELMPAEMYVPNQEQWLELRANKKKLHFNLHPLCCGEQ